MAPVRGRLRVRRREHLIGRDVDVAPHREACLARGRGRDLHGKPVTVMTHLLGACEGA